MKVGFIDRVIWSPDAKQIVGDMGYTFAEAPETVSKDIEFLRETVKNWVLSEETPEDFGNKKTGFAIYEVVEVESKTTDWWKINFSTRRVLEVWVCASQRQARGCGIEERYPNAIINYGR